jgi:hypothetical protein
MMVLRMNDFWQEYVRGGKESIVLHIAVYKHPLPSTEINLYSITHRTGIVTHGPEGMRPLDCSGLPNNDIRMQSRSLKLPVLNTYTESKNILL